MGTRGCNFKCPGCQNWEISHDSPDEVGGNLQELSPLDSVALAIRAKCHGICWTYNDPTIWVEHTFEAMVEAKKRGLYTAYITNGYATREQLDLIGPYLDAWRLDLKGFTRQSYKNVSGIARWEEILDIAKRAKFHWGMHVECVTNVTPTINDDPSLHREMARWICKELGEYTPWHLTRFYPYLDLAHLPPTPIEVLERSGEIGRQEGLRYVYIGNVPGHPWEHTYCHHCGTCIIRRRGFALAQCLLDEGKCPACSTEIPGRWDVVIRKSNGVRTPIFITKP
jgi:pyruvate formate lyase activating enzyme